MEQQDHVYLRKSSEYVQSLTITNDPVSLCIPSRVFFQIKPSTSILLLKTNDLRITNVSSSSYTAHVLNSKDTKAIKMFDKHVVEAIETDSDCVFEEQYTREEIDDMFVSSLNSNNELCLMSDGSFNVYDPNKCLIEKERFIEGIICRCALRPWILEYSKRVQRLRVCWIIDHCMILEEPIYTDCILDAEEEEDVPEEQEEDNEDDVIDIVLHENSTKKNNKKK